MKATQTKNGINYTLSTEEKDGQIFAKVFKGDEKLPFVGTSFSRNTNALDITFWANEKINKNIIEKYVQEGNGYDCARFIVMECHDNKKACELSEEFLNMYASLEDLIGDNDNPFDKNVAESIELNENYLKQITELFNLTILEL